MSGRVVLRAVGAGVLGALTLALGARAQLPGPQRPALEDSQPPAEPTQVNADGKRGVGEEEIVVTATRSESRVETVPASASVVTAETLENRNSNRVDEAIRYEVGVYGGKLRGLSSSAQTLVMLNGMPLNSGWYGGVRWENIGTENVERVEIVRGPTSALYGGNAMGGTINVITSLPKEFEVGMRTRLGGDRNRSYGGSVGQRFGERFAARVGFEFDQELVGRVTDYTWTPLQVPGTSGVPAGPAVSGGRFALDRDGRPRWIVGDEGERQESQWSVNLASAYEFSESESLRFDGQLGYSDYERKAPHSYLRDAEGGSASNGVVRVGDRYALVRPRDYLGGAGVDRNGSYMLTHTAALGAVDWVGKVGFQNEDKWYTTPTPGVDQGYTNSPGDVREFTTRTYFTDLQGSFGIGERTRITTGVYGRLNSFDQGKYLLANYRDESGKDGHKRELTRGTDRYFALYAQGEIELVPDRLTGYLGARFDLWQAYDGESGSDGEPLPGGGRSRPQRLADTRNSALSPSASLVWTPLEDTVLRASVARAFRAPTIYDLYRSYQSSPLSEMRSNPDLKPESLWNLEVGAVQHFWDRRLRLSGSVYQSEIESLIYSYAESGLRPRPDDPGRQDTYRITGKENAGQARVRGLELSAIGEPFDWLKLWANYTDTSARITQHSRNPALVGKRPTLMPDRIINTGFDVHYGWLRAGLAGQYVGRIFRNDLNNDIDGVFESNSELWLWELRVAADLPLKFVRLRSAQLSLTVRNLFDEDYFDYSIGRGRTVYAELRTKW